MNLDKQRARSATVKSNYDPKWNCEATFNIYDKISQNLNPAIFDADIGKDAILGNAVIDLGKFQEQQFLLNQWINLDRCKSEKVLIPTSIGDVKYNTQMEKIIQSFQSVPPNDIYEAHEIPSDVKYSCESCIPHSKFKGMLTSGTLKESADVNLDDSGTDTDDNMMNNDKSPVRIEKEELNRYAINNKKDTLDKIDDGNDSDPEDKDNQYEDGKKAMENDPKAIPWLNSFTERQPKGTKLKVAKECLSKEKFPCHK